MNTEILIKKSNIIHHYKYDYSETNYISPKIKVAIKCPIHGTFYQLPYKHLGGQGCPFCSGTLKKTTEQFIKKAREVHGDKYDYSKVEYKNSKTKVCIICPKHGEFWQIPAAHLNGQGCPKCGGSFKLSTDEFILKSKKIHGDNYDYSEVNYINSFTKVKIICNKCGHEFWQIPNSHLNGNGCPYCRGNKIRQSKLSNTEGFIAKSKIVHGDDYIYDEVDYKDAKTDVCIICKKHGRFWQSPDKHLYGRGCPVCGKTVSNAEIEIKKLIEDFIGNGFVEIHRKDIISPYEIDLWIPSLKIGIEYNEVRWHSEKFCKDKNYHLNKTEKCIKQNIKLYHIFEDEYVEHKEIVLSKIRNILGFNTYEKIYARKCSIDVIDKSVAKNFLNSNHIQGFTLSTVYLGCFYNSKLIGVMTFKKEIKTKNNWELTRFATDIRTHCIGVGGKMFKYFLKEYNPERVKSFADRRWTLDKNDNLYTKLGFNLTDILPPDYRYVDGIKRIHKFNCRKNKLLKKYSDNGLTDDMTEKEMCNKLGLYRIWDCGLLKYVWKK